MEISVIIPFHKEIALISRAVDSVLRNIENNLTFEILICNDGPFSELEIRSYLSPIANTVTKILINCNNKGPGGARNTGLDVCRGEYIAFLDADDVWLPSKIELQINAIIGGASFVATSYRFENEGPLVRVLPNITHPVDVFLQRGIGTSTVMVTRALIEGRRFRDFRFAQDIDYWYTLASSPKFRYVAIDVCCVEYSIGGSTKNKWVQLAYLSKVLKKNKISTYMQLRVFVSYIKSGIMNHYIKRWLS